MDHQLLKNIWMGIFCA